MKIFTYDIRGSELQVFVAAKWTKIYVNGHLSDWSMELDNNLFHAHIPTVGKITITTTMVYDDSKQNCTVTVPLEDKPILPLSIESYN